MKNIISTSVNRSSSESSAKHLLNALSFHTYILNAKINPVTGIIQSSHYATMIMAQMIEFINHIIFQISKQTKFQKVNAPKGVYNKTLVTPEPIEIRREFERIAI